MRGWILTICASCLFLTSCGTSPNNTPIRSATLHKFESVNVSFKRAKGSNDLVCRLPYASIKYSPEIEYDISLSNHRYFVYVPAGYDGQEQLGLMVYISSMDRVTDTPLGWNEVLNDRKILFVAPQEAGNSCPPGTRMGLAVLGALAIMKEYKIDPNRVYAAGLSGGARTACDLGFYQSDLFHGTVQDCGTNFYRPVDQRDARSYLDTNGFPYGLSELSAYHLAAVKNNVRFVLITGSNDFRRGNILDMYRYGFAKDGLQAKLIDVPGMGHSDCSPATLSQAIDFIEKR